MKANAIKHTMPKEILDAVDLQPQYRTFSEVWDYMLQQARGSECVPFDTESWYSHATCEYKH